MSGIELRTAFNDHSTSHEGRPVYFTDWSKNDRGVGYAHDTITNR